MLADGTSASSRALVCATASLVRLALGENDKVCTWFFGNINQRRFRGDASGGAMKAAMATPAVADIAQCVRILQRTFEPPLFYVAAIGLRCHARSVVFMPSAHAMQSSPAGKTPRSLPFMVGARMP